MSENREKVYNLGFMAGVKNERKRQKLKSNEGLKEMKKDLKLIEKWSREKETKKQAGEKK